MSSEKRLLTVKFCAVSAVPDPRYAHQAPAGNKADDLLKAMSRSSRYRLLAHEDVTNRSDTRHYQNIRQI